MTFIFDIIYFFPLKKKWYSLIHKHQNCAFRLNIFEPNIKHRIELGKAIVKIIPKYDLPFQCIEAY